MLMTWFLASPYIVASGFELNRKHHITLLNDLNIPLSNFHGHFDKKFQKFAKSTCYIYLVKLVNMVKSFAPSKAVFGSRCLRKAICNRPWIMENSIKKIVTEISRNVYNITLGVALSLFAHWFRCKYIRRAVDIKKLCNWFLLSRLTAPMYLRLESERFSGITFCTNFTLATLLFSFHHIPFEIGWVFDVLQRSESYKQNPQTFEDFHQNPLLSLEIHRINSKVLLTHWLCPFAK